MSKIAGGLVIVLLFVGLFYGIRKLLENPTGNPRTTLSTPASTFLPTHQDPSRPVVRPRVSPETERSGFVVLQKIAKPGATYYHQSQRDATGRPVLHRVEAGHYVLTEGRRSKERFLFRIEEAVFDRIVVGYEIPRDRLDRMTLVTEVPADPQPPSGYGLRPPPAGAL